MRIFVVFALVCLFSANAWGQVSRALMQETVGERVELTLRAGEKVEGTVRSVADTTLILRETEGRLRELRLSDVQEVKLVEVPVAAPTPAPARPTTSAAAPRTTGTSTAASTSTTAAPRASTVSATASAPASAGEPATAASSREDRIARARAHQMAVMDDADHRSQYGSRDSSSSRRESYSSQEVSARPYTRLSLGEENFAKGTKTRNIGIGLTTVGTIAGSLGFILKTAREGDCELRFDADYGLYDECEGVGAAGKTIGSIGFLMSTAGIPMIIAGGVRRGKGTRQINEARFSSQRSMSFTPSIGRRSVGARFGLEF